MTPQEVVFASIAAADAAARSVAAKGGPAIPTGHDGKCTVFDSKTKQPRRTWPVDAIEQVKNGFAVFTLDETPLVAPVPAPPPTVLPSSK